MNQHTNGVGSQGPFQGLLDVGRKAAGLSHPLLTTFVKTKIILPLNFPKHSKDRTCVLKAFSYAISKHLVAPVEVIFSVC